MTCLSGLKTCSLRELGYTPHVCQLDVTVTVQEHVAGLFGSSDVVGPRTGVWTGQWIICVGFPDIRSISEEASGLLDAAGCSQLLGIRVWLIVYETNAVLLTIPRHTNSV